MYSAPWVFPLASQVPPRGIYLWLHRSVTSFSSIWQRCIWQQAFTSCQPFFSPSMHGWTGNCDFFESYFLPGTVPHIQICPRWSHTGGSTGEKFNLQIPINYCGKASGIYLFSLIILANAHRQKWNSHLNWDFMYLLWDKSKWLRSPCNILKEKP